MPEPGSAGPVWDSGRSPAESAATASRGDPIWRTGADLALRGCGSLSDFGFESGSQGFEAPRDSMAGEIPVISGQQ